MAFAAPSVVREAFCFVQKIPTVGQTMGNFVYSQPDAHAALALAAPPAAARNAVSNFHKNLMSSFLAVCFMILFLFFD